MQMLVFTLLLACGPSMPTSADAQAAYSARSSFDALDADVRAALAAVPHLGTQAPPCPPATASVEGTPSDRGSLTRAVEEMEAKIRCNEAQIQRLEAQSKALVELHELELPQLMVQHDLIGLTLTTQEGTETRLLGSVGSQTPGKKKGTVDAANGESVGERQLGWGLYQDAKADHAYRPGLEVVWSFPHEGLTVDARATAWMP